ncbi:DUF4902 domain-containing protein [Steroidobacter cummioxidans]|uniref:DUF4902 domain-containing protein n=1 Tax=Steroidobacter cummioxidans TaxID=1803913 RepID=UPI00137A66D2|nr:DUF4902 domain-containing protein [Steroidobacter cummioxidans]
MRIPTEALAEVELRHLISEKDTSIAVPGGGATITGITEWVGDWHNQTVSIGWDWAVLDGVIVLVSPNEIRTNIQLISRTGSSEPPALAQIHLFHWIESLPWRGGAVQDLLAGERCLNKPR